MPYRPPFTITPRLIDLVSRISEELGRWGAVGPGLSPRLRRENRIRSIHASLAIENNTLSPGAGLGHRGRQAGDGALQRVHLAGNPRWLDFITHHRPSKRPSKVTLALPENR